MALKTLSEITELAELPADDVFVVQEVSDVSDGASGTTKKITAARARAGLASTTDLATVGEAVATHCADTDNPHGVTAAQAGAIQATSGAATVYVSAASEAAAGISALATLAESVAGSDTAKATTPAAVRQAVLSLMRDSLGKFPGITPPSLNLFCGDATSDTAPTGTFTRSTTGTRLGRTGLIEIVAAAGLCREWDAGGNLLGWLIERNRINVVLYSRDLTNVVWTKANCTAALNQTGIDGAVRAATLLTATADAATCLQSITVASSNRFQTAYLKRVTGSGAVSMTMDGGTTWTDITTSLSTTAWTRVSIPEQTLANLSVGFRLTTNGDAIAVDGVQNEAETFAASIIFTTSVAVVRSADVWTIPLSTSWFNTNVGTFFISGRVAPGIVGSAQVLFHIDDGSYKNRLLVYRNNGGIIVVKAVKSSVEASVNLGFAENYSIIRIAVSWTSAGFSACLCGGNCISSTSSTLPGNLASHIRIGNDQSGLYQWDEHILHCAYFPCSLPDTQLQAITL